MASFLFGQPIGIANQHFDTQFPMQESSSTNSNPANALAQNTVKCNPPLTFLQFFRLVHHLPIHLSNAPGTMTELSTNTSVKYFLQRHIGERPAHYFHGDVVIHNRWPSSTSSSTISKTRYPHRTSSTNRHRQWILQLYRRICSFMR